jgi:hypothetical protein
MTPVRIIHKFQNNNSPAVFLSLDLFDFVATIE